MQAAKEPQLAPAFTGGLDQVSRPRCWQQEVKSPPMVRPMPSSLSSSFAPLRMPSISETIIIEAGDEQRPAPTMVKTSIVSASDGQKVPAKERPEKKPGLSSKTKGNAQGSSIRVQATTSTGEVCAATGSRIKFKQIKQTESNQRHKCNMDISIKQDKFKHM